MTAMHFKGAATAPVENKKAPTFKKKRVTIEVRNDIQSKDVLYSPAYHADTARIKSYGKLMTPEKEYKLPS